MDRSLRVPAAFLLGVLVGACSSADTTAPTAEPDRTEGAGAPVGPTRATVENVGPAPPTIPPAETAPPPTGPRGDPTVRSGSPPTVGDPAPPPRPVQDPSPRRAGTPASDRRLELRSLPPGGDGEDGQGGIVPAADPLALDVVSPLDGPGVDPGGRAQDPVLRVGALRFHRATFPAPGRMRFIVADRALLDVGAAVWLAYGDEAAAATGPGARGTIPVAARLGRVAR